MNLPELPCCESVMYKGIKIAVGSREKRVYLQEPLGKVKNSFEGIIIIFSLLCACHFSLGGELEVQHAKCHSPRERSSRRRYFPAGEAKAQRECMR